MEIGGAIEPRELELPEADAAAAVIARAFAWHEPWGAWALPDEGTREETLRRLVITDLAERFIPAGLARTIELATIALWIPPPGEPGADALGSRRDDAAYDAYGERGPLLREADELIASLRPPQPHWYLDVLATDPARFGEGLAGRLLGAELARLDRLGAVTALDTHSERNRDFYARRGFVVIAEAQLPGGGPQVWVMQRRPGPAAERPQID